MKSVTSPATSESLIESATWLSDLEKAQARLSEMNAGVAQFIRQNPVTSLMAAAALGYLIGKVASRR